MSQGVALITGIGGQDGSYLAEQLLEKGYEVHGLVQEGLGLAEHLAADVRAHVGDLRDAASLTRAVQAANPTEIYHLAGVTAPGKSWDDPAGTFDVVALGTVRLLDAVATHAPKARFFLAGSAEIFGEPASAPQNEQTAFAPRNPYGAAKAAAVAATQAYRQGKGLFASVGVFYNHESPRRSVDFVTRKVTWHAAAIATGRVSELRIGNLDARRDWGYAPEYTDGAWRALQAPQPADYVFATGALHTVGELVTFAFERAGVPTEGHVVVDEAFVRPEGDVALVGDPAKARQELGWQAHTPFEALIAGMVDHDLEQLAA